MIRVDKEGKLKNSKPCNHCLETMRMFGIKVVYYSTDEGDIKKCKLDEIIPDHLSGRQISYYKFIAGKTESPLKNLIKKKKFV